MNYVRASYINAALSRLSDYLNNSENGLLLSINFLLKNIEYTIKGVLSGMRQFLATESPLKMMKNASYLTLKALSVLKIFMFLS